MDTHTEVQNEKRDRGFTLVELLIVIVILGVLATVTVFAVRGITDKGKTSACQADKKTLEVAVESYFAQWGGAVIPTVAAELPAGATFAANADPELTLENAQFIRDPSPKYNVTAAGGLTYQTADCGAAGAAVP